MWFHILSVAAFVALGSCRGHFGLLRAEENVISSCTGPGCPCTCSIDYCPPCPLPMPVNCLTACGTSECPCLNAKYNQRAEKNGTTQPEESRVKAQTVSTVNIYPFGPICSGFHILPHLLVTMSSCIAGKDMKDLFVTVYDKESNTKPVKVVEVQIYPYKAEHVDPVVLVLEKSGVQVDYLALPPLPIDEQQPAEIHKWYVTKEGKEYAPYRTILNSHSKCKDGTGDLLCATAPTNTEMGWNDIGTPLIEIRHQDLVAQGIYMGHNLYQSIATHKYLPLFQYSPWLYRMIEMYS